MGFLLQNYGILQTSQGVIPPSPEHTSRPSTAIEMLSAALNQQTGDNQFKFNANTNQAFTIANWFLAPASFGGVLQVMSGRETSSANRHHQYYLINDVTKRGDFLTQIGGTSKLLQINSLEEFNKEKWFFVVVQATLGNVEMNMFIYNEEQLLTSGTTTVYEGINPNDNFKFLINSARLGINDGYGTYNSFGVWNRFITQEEVAELWNEGYGLSYEHITGSTLNTGINEWWDMDNWNGISQIGQANGAIMVNVGTTINTVDVNSNKGLTLPVTGATAWYSDVVNGGFNRKNLANGTAITQWDDLSGNDNPWYKDASNAAPTYDATNNRIAFNGIDQLLRNNLNIASTGGTGFFVITQSTNAGAYIIGNQWLNGDTGANSSAILSYNTADGVKLFGSAADGLTPAVAAQYATNAELGTVPHIYEFDFTANSDTILRLDGTQVLSINDTGDFSNSNSHWRTMGKERESSTDYRDSDFYELIYYNRRLSPTEIEQVEAYLNNKYSIY